MKNTTHTNSARARASAPGKIILFGEHAVLYGTNAISAALSDLRIFVNIHTILPLIEEEQEQLVIYLRDVEDESSPIIVSYATIKRIVKNRNLSEEEDLSEQSMQPLRDEFSTMSHTASQATMAIVFLFARLLPEFLTDADTPSSTPRGTCNGRGGVCIDVKSKGLPVGAGLGSSAAFSVALSGAILKLRQELFGPKDNIEVEAGPGPVMGGESSGRGRCPPHNLLPRINSSALFCERIMHGKVSGLDNSTCCYGGAMRYDGKTGSFEVLNKLPDIRILLTDTKVPRRTKEQVANVRLLFASLPAVIQPIFASIDAITQRFLQIIGPSPQREGGDVEAEISEKQYLEREIAMLIRVNQGLLEALGVGHPALARVCEASNIVGFPCKLTGAGGGGCAISLLSGETEKKDILTTKLNEFGFDTFESSIAGEGILWYVD